MSDWSMHLELDEVPLHTDLAGIKYGPVNLVVVIAFDVDGNWKLTKVGIPAFFDKDGGPAWFDDVPGSLGGILYRQIRESERGYIEDKIDQELTERGLRNPYVDAHRDHRTHSGTI